MVIVQLKKTPENKKIYQLQIIGYCVVTKEAEHHSRIALQMLEIRARAKQLLGEAKRTNGKRVNSGGSHPVSYRD